MPRGAIIRYGVVLGYAKADIPAGAWINEHMLDLPDSPGLDNLPYGTNVLSPEQLPMPKRTTWLGYRNKVGLAGTRNLLGIVTTVQCAAGVLKVAVERIKRELLPKFPNVDGVVAVTHPYGCGVAINAPMAYIPIRAITNVIRHPNFGGEIMVVGLGCEKLTYDRVLPPEDITPENVLTLQDYPGHDAMTNAILDMADRKLQKLNQRRREELPLSELLIGMQCGGSDAFSGITANPSAGYAADMIVRGGGTVMFSEVTEVWDGVQMLAALCPDAHTRDRLAEEMKWYDDYLAAGGRRPGRQPHAGQQEGRPCQHRGKGHGLHCQERHQPHCGSPLPCPEAHEARSDLRRDPRQRHRLRPQSGGQRHRLAGLHDRPWNALWTGHCAGHQGLQPERDESPLV